MEAQLVDLRREKEIEQMKKFREMANNRLTSLYRVYHGFGQVYRVYQGFEPVFYCVYQGFRHVDTEYIRDLD